MLLAVTEIAKSFAGVRALSGISFDLASGEVHALVGENGAGKSTLIRIITGAETADAGTIVIAGHDVPQMDPHQAQRLGIAAIYQQPALFPDLTVAENIALALEGGHLFRRVDWRGRRDRAAMLLDRVGASIDPDRLVGSLTMPEQQLVEIAKAIGTNARILIMDEPTASLSEREVQRLFDVIRTLRGQGVGIVYISHRLEEIEAIADRITILRDGRSMTTRPASELSRADIIKLMVGREVVFTAMPQGQLEAGAIALELDGVGQTESGVHDVSLHVRHGQIVCLAGLVGSGRSELAEIVFGLRPADSGEIRIDGTARRIESPLHAIRAGVGYLPEDRRRHGVILEMSVAANISLAHLADVASGGLIDAARERTSAAEYVERFRIKTPDTAAPVETLSGGNQQKVALARWLSISPTVLVLDEPTQGVDIGSKAEIHSLVRELAARGLAVLVISSELSEVLALAHRILVMRAGTLVGELSPRDATQDAVLALALGHRDESPPATAQ
jgi:rhamnose transport system ATP-binding protein